MRKNVMRLQMGRWLPLAAAGLVFLAAVLVVRAAPYSTTKDMLSFGGTLTQNGKPLMGQQTLTFAFKKNGMTICSPTSMVTPDATTGAFDAQIDISNCPGATLFDGGDVTVDLSVGNNLIAANQPINPVPYAKYADRVGVKDCPNGYTRDPAAMGIVLCKKPLANGAFDEMVRVMTGGQSFWIDRYEATIWQKPDASGTQYGLFQNDLQNVQTYYAASKAGVRPAGFMTYYSAMIACGSSGKQMPRAMEWYVAGQGSPITTNDNGMTGNCVSSLNNIPRNTGSATNCASMWGAQDMAGNMPELIFDQWQTRSELGTNWSSANNVTTITADYLIGIGVNLPFTYRDGFRCVMYQ